MTDTDHLTPSRPITPQQLRELCVKSNGPAIFRILVQYATILGNGWAILHVAGAAGVLWAAPLVLLQAFLVSFQFMVVHETAHKTAFRTRALNGIVGHISGALIALPYDYYILFHWDHHRYTQDMERDPELVFKTVPDSWLKLLFTISGVSQLFKRLLLTARHAVTGRAAMPWVPEAKRGLVVLEARLHMLLYLVLLAGSILLQTDALLWGWLLPLVLGQLMLRPYLLSEHTGCATTASALENTRTTYTNPLMHWFTWNMPYHAEHHAYPSVPFHALPRLNALIDDRILHKGDGYPAVVREVWTFLRRRALQSPAA